MTTFAEQIAAFNDKYQARLRVTAQESVQEVVSVAQRTIYEGGRMRIKTGFLRASIQAALGTMPAGPSDNPRDINFPVGMQASGSPVSVTLLRWDINTGTPIYVGWTANYARHREAFDGFLRGALEQWDAIVEKNAKRVRNELG